LKTEQRRRRSPEEAKAEILNAAYEFLAETDHQDLTVDIVMQRTGMTRSSFYHYFSGINEVVVSMLDKFEEDVLGSVEVWLSGDMQGQDHLEATGSAFQRMFSVMHDHRQSLRAVSQVTRGDSPAYKQWQTHIIESFADLTEVFIKKQIRHGRCKVADPAGVARALILMNNAVFTDNLAREKPKKPVQLANSVAAIWNATIFS